MAVVNTLRRKKSGMGLLLLAPLVLAACCVGQSKTAVHGMVENWTTGEPIGGVTVEATVLDVPDGMDLVSPDAVTAAEDGSFVFEALPRGAKYRFEVRGSEWVTMAVTATTSLEESSSQLPNALLANPWPDLVLNVRDCLLGAPLEGVEVAIAGRHSATTGAEGKVSFTKAAPPGNVTVAAEPSGYTSSSADVLLPSSPPFLTEANLDVCPLITTASEGEPLLYARHLKNLEVVSIPPSSVEDEHAGRPYFSADRFAVNAAWYMLDDRAPVIPFSDLDTAPDVGPLRRFLVRNELLRGRRDVPGALLGRIVRTDSTGQVTGVRWKTDGLFRKPVVPRLPRSGGIVGVNELGAPSYDSRRFEVWTTWYKLQDRIVKGVQAPAGYSVVDCPSSGQWAVVVATGRKPWKIYPISASD